jgi:hypothetical protein
MEGALGPSETPVSLPMIFEFDAGSPCRRFMSGRVASGFFLAVRDRVQHRHLQTWHSVLPKPWLALTSSVSVPL